MHSYKPIEILSTSRSILMLGFSIPFCCTALPRNFCKLSQLLLELFITLYKHITYQSEYIVLTNGLSSDQRLTHKNSQLLFMIVLHNLREKATVKCTAWSTDIWSINPTSGNDIRQKSRQFFQLAFLNNWKVKKFAFFSWIHFEYMRYYGNNLG